MLPLYAALEHSIAQHAGNAAMFVEDKSYTYKELGAAVNKIRKALRDAVAEDEKIIGILTNEDLYTYAAIIALWAEGKAYVPVNTDLPKERYEAVISLAGIHTIIGVASENPAASCHHIDPSILPESAASLPFRTVADTELAYLLFTSGTTGVPKGVPITRANLAGFVTSFETLGLSITAADRCLQMFELTFDLSVMSYLIPFLKGACIYLIPKTKIKYGYIYELMEEQALTVALMVPSILHYLRPYFDEIDFPQMRYSLFCGEALSLDITQEWSRCLPNAEIINVYGPTEDTIFCTHYHYSRTAENLAHNGILSIGRMMEGNDSIIIDEENKIVEEGLTGQLCLSGAQLTPGYWHNEEKNREAFFTMDYKDSSTRFYKTGDLCTRATSGDILYLGRTDHQVKIQGFRVELSEIEFQCKQGGGKANIVAIPFENKIGNTEIGLVIESTPYDTDPLKAFLSTKLPAYMMPTSILFEERFPLNVNGKTDRNELKKRFLR